MADGYKKNGGFDLRTNKGKQMQEESRRGCIMGFIVIVIGALVYLAYQWISTGEMPLKELIDEFHREEQLLSH